MFGLFADDDVALARGEPDDQADFFSGSPDLVPRNPEAVGVPDLRFAVVRGELLGREDVLAIRFDIVRRPPLFVKGIDDQSALDFDRVGVLAVVEHHPPAKTSRAGMSGPLQHGFMPNSHDAGRRIEVVDLPHRPGNVLLEIESRAARKN